MIIASVNFQKIKRYLFIIIIICTQLVKPLVNHK